MNTSKTSAARNACLRSLNSTRTAKLLIKSGFGVCRIDPEKKKPTYSRWTTSSLDADDIAPDDQIGILAGPLSDGGRPGHAIMIIDEDDPRVIKAADKFLPPTKMAEGRPSKPGSHRYYLVPVATIPEGEHSSASQAAPAALAAKGHPGPRTRSFRDPGGRELLRLIGTGGQANCPPSRHPSGERRTWVGGSPGGPAVVDYSELLHSVEQLAAECGWVPKVHAPPPDLQQVASVEAPLITARLNRRVQLYLAACPPAVSGHGGHDRLFAVAVALAHGFALDAATAVDLLLKHYNPRCRPTWTLKDIRHKVEDALRASHDKPRGHMLSAKGDAVPPLSDDTPALIRSAYAARVKEMVALKAGRGRRRATR